MIFLTVVLGTGYVFGIGTNGTNVYSAGDIYYTVQTYTSFIATAWKDSSLMNLQYANSTYFWCHSNAVAAEGDDVYVAGWSLDPAGTGRQMATYWKNGVPVVLSYGVATGIAISGDDIVVCGNGSDNEAAATPRYWKNGVPTILPEGLSATCIAIVKH